MKKRSTSIGFLTDCYSYRPVFVKDRKAEFIRNVVTCDNESVFDFLGVLTIQGSSVKHHPGVSLSYQNNHGGLWPPFAPL